jgi:hypothetical protein
VEASSQKKERGIGKIYRQWIQVLAVAIAVLHRQTVSKARSCTKRRYGAHEVDQSRVNLVGEYRQWIQVLAVTTGFLHRQTVAER